jgi:acetyltransferase-like isoleucine patch superfamily enzyme
MINWIDRVVLGALVRWLWPQYNRPKQGYITNRTLLRQYFFWQKIWRRNGRVPWPVHHTSTVRVPEKITKGAWCDPGDSPGIYINAANGIVFGSNIEIGPNTCIMSVNHDLQNYLQGVPVRPIHIGNNVWIGANVSILPGVHIGHNVVIGAGSVVTKDIPDNSVAAGVPCRVIRLKPPYTGPQPINNA